MDADYLVDVLGLKPHPEGGYYRRIYQSEQEIETESHRRRTLGSAIYYLLKGGEKSLFHRLRSDELWLFHQGNTLEICMIEQDALKKVLLGTDVKTGESPQILIPANTWFAAQIKDKQGFVLVSCVVIPGFDFEDFELAKREKLIADFPHLKEIIECFTI